MNTGRVQPLEITDEVRKEFGDTLTNWIREFKGGNPSDLCFRAFESGSEYAVGAEVAFWCACQIARLLSLGVWVLDGANIKRADLKNLLPTKIKQVSILGNVYFGQLYFRVES